MRSRYKVILNDVSLADISPKIIIHDVNHTSPSISRETAMLANRNGMWGGDLWTDTGAIVEVVFEIHEYSIQKRQQICQDIVAWAVNGGVLQTNDRPDQIFRCKCDVLPAVASVRDWTEELVVQFTGYEYPFWTELHDASIALSGTSVTGELFVPGNALKTFVEAEITATAALQSITVVVGDTSITLLSIGAVQGDKIRIHYDDSAIQHIELEHGETVTSILNKRTRLSSDDLLASCGMANAVSISASSVVSAVLSAKGVWL